MKIFFMETLSNYTIWKMLHLMIFFMFYDMFLFKTRDVRTCLNNFHLLFCFLYLIMAIDYCGKR